MNMTLLVKEKTHLIPRRMESSRKFKLDFNREEQNALREQILKQVQRVINKKISFGYELDLTNSLKEINITTPKYLEVILYCLGKQMRNFSDIQLIHGYLYFMKDLINLMKKQNETHFNEYLQTIAMYLGYEYLDHNQILCKFGEKGKKAYVVLQGQIDILIKQNKKVRITQQDYFNYLATLFHYQEYGLLNLILKENLELFPVEIIDQEDSKYSYVNNETKDENQQRPSLTNNGKLFIWLAPFGKKNEDLNTLTHNQLEELYNKYNSHFHYRENINSVSSEDYINRIKVYNEMNEEEEFKRENIGYKVVNVWVYSYIKVVSRPQGALIGEIALSDPSALRTATMITSEDTHLGTINKNSYNLTLKSAAEKQRRQNVLFIKSFKPFNEIPLYSFGKRYFNNFHFEKKEKGCCLMRERDINDNLFLLKEGEYEVSIKCSLCDLNNLKFILYKKEFSLHNQKFEINDPIIKKKERYFELLMDDNPQFKREFYRKSKIVIANISSPDMIGLDDYMDDNGNCLFTVECKSVRGEMYLLGLDFYSEMKRNDKTVRVNERELMIERLRNMIERIDLMIKSFVDSFYDYKSKRKKFHLDFQIHQDFLKNKFASPKGKFNCVTSINEKLSKRVLELIKTQDTNKVNSNHNLVTDLSGIGKSFKNVNVMDNVDSMRSEGEGKEKEKEREKVKKIGRNENNLIIKEKSTITERNFKTFSISGFKDSNGKITPRFDNIKEYSKIFQPMINLKLSRNLISTEYSQFQFSFEKKSEVMTTSTCNNNSPIFISPLKLPYTIKMTTNSNSLSVRTRTSEKYKRKRNSTLENKYPKENLVDIEKYKTFKKKRYLQERMKYLLNQAKKQGNRFAKLRLINK